MAFGAQRALSAEKLAIPAILLGLETDGEAVLLKFDRAVELKIIHLDSPPRIIFDLPETNFASLETGVVLPELVGDIRFGLISSGHSRIVLSLSMPAIATANTVISPSQMQQVTFATVDASAFSLRASNDALLFNQDQNTRSSRLGESPAQDGPTPFTVVIDPGHGGIDGGAEGKLGTREKDITLAFAQAIRGVLASAPNVRVVMTRDIDKFVGLHERVKIARDNNAQLFLSLHADSIKLAQIRGATVYTLSDSASDAISDALANQENLADSIAGLPPFKPDADTNSILVDLLKVETATFSRDLASQIIVHLKENAVELINNPLRAAGFSVLTAPDVPSILLEMGYLSNHQDELLLRDAKWRDQTAAVIAKAIETYAKKHRTGNSTP